MNKRFLSTQQREILYLLSVGYSQKAIAQKLFISYATCKKMIGDMVKDFNAKNTTNCVVLALRDGYIK